MRKVLLLIFTIFSFHTYAQEILMQNGTTLACSGTFLDSGGAASSYSNSENFVITICPENDGDRMRLDFTEFNTQLNTDFLNIYDGDSTTSQYMGSFSGANSPGFVEASLANSSGCLTFEFFSDSGVTATGWNANISCIEDCQIITSQIDSAVPAPNSDGFIRVCTNEIITLSGSGNFEIDGTGATYEWDLGNGEFITGQIAIFSFDTPGVYPVNLNIRDDNTDDNPLGCPNTNGINQIIQVSNAPDFTGTEAFEDVICFGNSTTIAGVVNPIPVFYDCPPPVSGTTFLPDGSGISYSTCVTVDCFDSNAVLSDVSQLIDICINMEHSYVGDLRITLISPNGQQTILKDYPGGGGAFLGGANDDGTEDPGIGADYCFSMSGAATLINGPTIIAGSNPPSDSITPGTYLPEESFANLIGSPLNGQWCIEIIDNLAIDNGYVFSWEVNFDPDIPQQDFSFTSVITSESWDADASITDTNGSTITVAPATSGEHCYTYRVLDDFGCEYLKEVCITVNEVGDAVTYYADFDDDGFGDPDDSIEGCSIPTGYVNKSGDCDDTDDTINPDAIDIPNNNIDENCDGVDTLGIEEISARDLSIYPNPFNSSITIDLPLGLRGNNLYIDIYDVNGRLVYGKKEFNVDSTILISNLDRLEDAFYFIKISTEITGFSIIKKLAKLNK